MIYDIQIFQDTSFQNEFFPYAFQTPDPAARPSARHGSQVIELVRVPVFPGSQVVKLIRFPVFPGYQKYNPSSYPYLSIFQVPRSNI